MKVFHRWTLKKVRVGWHCMLSSGMFDLWESRRLHTYCARHIYNLTRLNKRHIREEELRGVAGGWKFVHSSHISPYWHRGKSGTNAENHSPWFAYSQLILRLISCFAVSVSVGEIGSFGDAEHFFHAPIHHVIDNWNIVTGWENGQVSSCSKMGPICISQFASFCLFKHSHSKISIDNNSSSSDTSLIIWMIGQILMVSLQQPHGLYWVHR